MRLPTRGVMADANLTRTERVNVSPTLQMRVFQRAAELLRSERMLARRLRISVPTLFLFLNGRETPTQELFLAAVDVLIEFGDPEVLDGDGRVIPPKPLGNGPSVDGEKS
jgi:hypothetical protein